MDPFKPEPPVPPRPAPPSPPRPELIAPREHQPASTPMMDFFQRRLESLERELAIERERAASASALLQQQEALKSEVEGHLKALTEQLRREKAEREGEEAKSHSRGRVEALEHRLDEMNATFAQLLKDAVSRQSPAAATAPVSALGAEVTALRGAMKDVVDQMSLWREEMKRPPEARGIASRVPQDGHIVESRLARRFEEFASQLQGTMSDWERRHDMELRKQDDRLRSLAEERASLSRMWTEQTGAIRSEFLKERIARETAVSDQIAELARRLDAASREQSSADGSLSSIREALDKIAGILTAAPKAKDEIIVELEQEKADLLRAMRERHEQLRAMLEERRQIEQTMGDSLLQLSSELEKERTRTREALARADDIGGREADLTARIASLERSIAERDARILSVGAERDELTRALVAEADKVRAQIAERTAADERWHQRLLELQRKVEDEAARAGQEAASSGDLRAKVATLSEHMARALQERDAVVARFADWERERQRLLDALKQKDGMVAMLSSAFQGSLKNSNSER